jgi:CRISPR-associated protein Cas1
MQSISSSELKTILHSKRANIYYLEYCRVLVNGGRVEYVTDEGRRSLYWNIPIANTTSILLGTGTSITQAAMREFSKAGVLVGFCGGGGTPLFSSMENDFEVAWFSPQSEYRPTEYLQRWVRFWFTEELRLQAAKILQKLRHEFIIFQWTNNPDIDSSVTESVSTLIVESQSRIAAVQDSQSLLTEEARLTKALYKMIAAYTGYGQFSRSKRGRGFDPANSFLDHGNYLAYGLGATATWVLGLPHGLSVLHGKTRRGGLVFDAADIVKDAVVLPLAFLSAAKGDTNQDFREACIAAFVRAEALDHIIDGLKIIAKRVPSAVQ